MSMGPTNETFMLSRGLYRGRIVCLNCHTNAYMKLYVHEAGNVIMSTWFRCSRCGAGYAFPTQSHFLNCPQCDGEGLMWNFSDEEMLKEAPPPYVKIQMKVPCDLCHGRKWARIRTGEVR